MLGLAVVVAVTVSVAVVFADSFELAGAGMVEESPQVGLAVRSEPWRTAGKQG